MRGLLRIALSSGILLATACGGRSVAPAPAPGPVEPRLRVDKDGLVLRVELWDDDLVHFELAPADEARPDEAIPVSVMVAAHTPSGPSSLSRIGAHGLRTAELEVTVDPATLCLRVVELKQKNGAALGVVCPDTKAGGFRFRDHAATHAYGLGQQFVDYPQFGDLMGRVRRPGNAYGNHMGDYMGGAVGNIQIPVLLALGEDSTAFGLFVDVPEGQRWDLRQPEWAVDTKAKHVRGYLMTGPDALDVRRDTMALLGRPPVPPRPMFGLWISEYGFDDAAEAESKIETLRAGGYPVDGLVLDLQWFGDIEPKASSRMGALTWDTRRFPEPKSWIARLAQHFGVGVMPIEESYVVPELPVHAQMAEKGHLVRQCETCPPIEMDSWWGKGGMVDWSHLEGAAAWHDAKRAPLVDLGVVGHWTDLGEPEDFDPKAWYAGGQRGDRHDQRAIHNLYNFYWSRSIVEGYARQGAQRRPFILSRSGTAGSQRFGVAMWSGDIGSNAESLEAHFEAQAHMSMSGIDYFGSDVGGFKRGKISDEDLDALYTFWFASSALLDVPLRPHVNNLDNAKETAPDRVGDRPSNLANLRLRYALTPYYYALAWRAWRHGEPVVPPLALHYGADAMTRDLWNHKTIGRDLLTVVVADPADAVDVYLPAGRWIDFHSHVSHDGARWLKQFPIRRGGAVRLPLFARAGAILPMMPVDADTLNTRGERRGGDRDDTLALRVYADVQPSMFTVFEDDGATIAYRDGAVRETDVRQVHDDGGVSVEIGAARGVYAGAPDARPQRVDVVVARGPIVDVTLDGRALPELADAAAFEAAAEGWFAPGPNRATARTTSAPVNRDRTWRFAIR